MLQAASTRKSCCDRQTVADDKARVASTVLTTVGHRLALLDFCVRFLNIVILGSVMANLAFWPAEMDGPAQWRPFFKMPFCTEVWPGLATLYLVRVCCSPLPAGVGHVFWLPEEMYSGGAFVM